jgi:hypothetical protein
MHLAKNVIWRYIIQLWLDVLRLDQELKLQQQQQLRGMQFLPEYIAGVAAADLDKKEFSVLMATDSMIDTWLTR